MSTFYFQCKNILFEQKTSTWKKIKWYMKFLQVNVFLIFVNKKGWNLVMC